MQAPILPHKKRLKSVIGLFLDAKSPKIGYRHFYLGWVGGILFATTHFTQALPIDFPGHLGPTCEEDLTPQATINPQRSRLRFRTRVSAQTNRTFAGQPQLYPPPNKSSLQLPIPAVQSHDDRLAADRIQTQNAWFQKIDTYLSSILDASQTRPINWTATWEALLKLLELTSGKTSDWRLRFGEIEQYLKEAEQLAKGTVEIRQRLWSQLQVLRMEEAYNRLQHQTIPRPVLCFFPRPWENQGPNGCVDETFSYCVANLLLPDTSGSVEASSFSDLQTWLEAIDSLERLQYHCAWMNQCHQYAKANHLGNGETRGALETLIYQFRPSQWEKVNAMLQTNRNQIIAALFEQSDANTIEAISPENLDHYLALLLDPNPMPAINLKALWDGLTDFLELDLSSNRISMSGNRHLLKAWSSRFDAIEKSLNDSQYLKIGDVETRNRIFGRLHALQMEGIYRQLQNFFTQNEAWNALCMPQTARKRTSASTLIAHIACLLSADECSLMQSDPFLAIQQFLDNQDEAQTLQCYFAWISQCYEHAKEKNLGTRRTRGSLERLLNLSRPSLLKEVYSMLQMNRDQVMASLFEQTGANAVKPISPEMLDHYWVLLFDPHPMPQRKRKAVWDALSHFLQLEPLTDELFPSATSRQLHPWASHFDAIAGGLGKAERRALGTPEIRRQLRAYLRILNMEEIYHQLQDWTMQVHSLLRAGGYYPFPHESIRNRISALFQDAGEMESAPRFEKRFNSHIACILVPDARSFTQADSLNTLQALLDPTNNPEKAEGYYQWVAQGYQHAKENNLGNAETRSALEMLLNESRSAQLKTTYQSLQGDDDWAGAVTTIEQMNSNWNWLARTLGPRYRDCQRINAFRQQLDTIVKNPKSFGQFLDTCVSLILDPRQINLPNPNVAQKVLSHFLQSSLNPDFFLQARFRNNKENMREWAYHLNAIQRRAQKADQYELGTAQTRKQLRIQLIVLRMEGLYHQLQDPFMRQSVLKAYSSSSAKKCESLSADHILGMNLALMLDPNPKDAHAHDMTTSWPDLQSAFNRKQDLLSTQFDIESIEGCLHYAKTNGIGSWKTQMEITSMLKRLQAEQLGA